MTANNKRSWRWSSKGFFGAKVSNKRTLPESTNGQHTDSTIPPSALVGMSLDSNSSYDGRATSNLSSRKSRTNSMLLSLVGIQRSGTRTANKSSSHTSERDVALAIAIDAAKPSSSPHPSAEGGGRAHPFISYEKSGSPRKNDNTQAPLATIAETDVRVNAHQPPLELTTVGARPGVPKGLRHSLSNPSLAHQISHKLSQTFGNPTIVHRPNSRTRPSLISVRDQPLMEPELRSDQNFSPQGSTSPSSYNYSGSISTTDPSTGKTSLESSPGTPRSVKARQGRELPAKAEKVSFADKDLRENTLTPIQEAPHPITPTLVTVETTANAKIFFETHFNSLLAGHASPRSIRRRDLELYFDALSLPEELRHIERWAWANHETDHLRQNRVLKSRSNESTRRSGVAIAGYEIVRILGKGSFGVVRLVREKETSVNGHLGGLPNSLPVQNLTQQHGADNASFSRIDSDAIKSTFEGHKATKRQIAAKSRREVYAMKVIRKSDMLRNCQEGHLRAERDFLVASEKSRWVVPLIASFQDNTNLYLVMEYMVGGDFLGLLFRKDKLKEKQARWYIAEMILCVEETHRSRWIHRDIKPDNFLISSSGHLKISDFGLAFDGHWAHDQKYYKNTRASLMEKLGIKVRGDSEDQEEDDKKKPRSSLANILTGRRGDSPPKSVQFDGPNERESVLQWKDRTGKRRMAGSVVGTSQYMAPEVIRGDPYDGRCDWWSIGIILYECLYGFTPFVCDNREDTKAKILDNAHSLIFPDERDTERIEKVSFEAMELINSLLQEKEHRLSSNKYRTNDWQHARHRAGQVVTRRADPSSQDYPGNFVYPDDACDIKAHPFFNRIIWERLHLTRPPWVPLVSGKDDTKWFDDEEGMPISDVDDAASRTDDGEGTSDQMTIDGRIVVQVTQVDGVNAQPDKQPTNSVVVTEDDDAARQKAAKTKAKKRPRDRVLRDKELGRKALDLRKKGAFLGYTYRRPKLVSFDDEREKQWVARRSLIPSFE